MSSSMDLTDLLRAWSGGERGVEDSLVPLVYEELRKIAAAHLGKERVDHTLEPTALVHEAYLRLVRMDRLEWKDRNHFYAMASRTMRRVLVDHARGHEAEKRGAEWVRLPVEAIAAALPIGGRDLLVVDDALAALAAIDPLKASIVEQRFFGGLSMSEIADNLDCSQRTVARHWRMAKAWLSRQLQESGNEP